MNRTLKIIGYGLLTIALGGCTSFIRPTTKVEKIKGATPPPSYSGLKAKIALVDFEIRVAKATADIGPFLREKLIDALVNSNRFSILKRQDLSAPKSDEGLSSSLLIAIAVTEFEPQSSGGSAGIGGGGGVGRGFLGGLLSTPFNKPHIALDIRIVDNFTSEVLASTRVKGQTSDMEHAIHICIVEAVRYISESIPVNYYKY